MKYHYEARDGGYVMAPLHIPTVAKGNNDDNQGSWSTQGLSQFDGKIVHGSIGCSSGLSTEKRWLLAEEDIESYDDDLACGRK